MRPWWGSWLPQVGVLPWGVPTPQGQAGPLVRSGGVSEAVHGAGTGTGTGAGGRDTLEGIPATRTGEGQPITLSMASTASSQALSGLVPRCSMLLIWVEMESLMMPSFGPSTAAGMTCASWA